MQPSNLAKRAWFLLFAAITGFYLYGLGRVPLVGPDEPRYAEVAREMLSRRDLITPTLGGLPWFEKPPLLYWMMMGSYRIFGVNEFAARLGPAVCGLVTALLVYWIAFALVDGDQTNQQSANGQQAYSIPSSFAPWSGLVLLSNLGVLAFSRAASFDIVVTMTLTGAFAFFLVWTIRNARIRARGRSASFPVPRSGLGLLLGFYLFVGLSLLAKGLIGIIIPVWVIGLYFVLRRASPPRVFLKSLLWGVPLALATAALWYGPMIARHGWTFIDRFILQHHFARFFSNKYHHPAPFYFYLLTLTWLVLPWTIFLASACLSARKWDWRGPAPIDHFRVFALAWLVAPVVFFSFSDSKLPAYLLPVVPAAALLVGESLARRQATVRVIQLTGVLLLVLGVCGIWYSSHAFPISLTCAVSIALGAMMVGAFALLAPRRRQIVFWLFALTPFAAGVVAINCAALVAAQRESVRDLLVVAAQRGYGATPIVQLFAIQRTAEFYAAGRLTYRSDGEPKMLEGGIEVADAARSNGGVVLCLVPKEYEAELLTYPEVYAEELANNGKVGLLVLRVRISQTRTGVSERFLSHQVRSLLT